MTKYRSGKFIYDKENGEWVDICKCKQVIDGQYVSPIDEKLFIRENSKWVSIDCVEVILCFVSDTESPLETELIGFDIIGQGVVQGETFTWEVEPRVGNDNMDFSSYSGSFSINDSKGRIEFQSLCDNLTEGDEAFDIKIYDNEGDLVTIFEFLLKDFCVAPEFRFNESAYNVGEDINQSQNGVRIQIDNQAESGVPTSGTLYYKVEFNGTDLIPEDLIIEGMVIDNNGNGIGEIIITDDFGEVIVSANCDNLSEGNETFIMRLYSDSDRLEEVDSTELKVLDFCRAPNFAFFGRAEITEDPDNQLRKRQALRVGNTSNSNSGVSELYYLVEFNGSNLSPKDIIINGMTIDANGNGIGVVELEDDEGSILIKSVCDNITEGDEKCNIRLYTDSARTEETSMTTIKVIDFCLSPDYKFAKTQYEITEDPNDFSNSGNIVVENMSEDSFIENDEIYFKLDLDGTNLTVDDFEEGFVNQLGEGFFTIKDNRGNKVVRAKCDYITEGDETFTIILYSDLDMTDELDRTELKIIDFCLTPEYKFTQEVYETTETDDPDNSATIVVENVAEEGFVILQDIYYLIDFDDNTLTPNDMTIFDNTIKGDDRFMRVDREGNGVGKLRVSDNNGSLTLIANCDNIAEADETFIIELFLDEKRTELLDTAEIKIIDFCGPPQYRFTESSYVIFEDENSSNHSVVMEIENISGRKVQQGGVGFEILVNDSVSLDDITTNPATFQRTEFGSVRITDDKGTLTVTANCDGRTEGDESFKIRLYPDNSRREVILDEAEIKIIDFCVEPIYRFSESVYVITENENSENPPNRIFIEVRNTRENSFVRRGEVYFKIEFDGTTLKRDDFSEKPFNSDGTGVIFISDNTGFLRLSAKCDDITEEDETFTMRLYSDKDMTEEIDVTEIKIIDFCR